MGRVLVAYGTKKGSTYEVAQSIAAVLRAHGDEVDVLPAADVTEVAGYDAAIVGGSLYTGRWHRDARSLLKRHRAELAAMPVAVYAMGPKSLDETSVADSRAQLEHALAEAPEIDPVSIAIFGGVIDPSKLHFPFNRMAAVDARDWRAIESWAAGVHARLADGVAAP